MLLLFFSILEYELPNFDVLKKVKFSSVAIRMTVARPVNAKWKAICHLTLSFKLRVSVTSATNSKYFHLTSCELLLFQFYSAKFHRFYDR